MIHACDKSQHAAVKRKLHSYLVNDKFLRLETARAIRDRVNKERQRKNEWGAIKKINKKNVYKIFFF